MNKNHPLQRDKKRARRFAYRRRQQSTSIFFLLWTAFSVLSLVVLLLVSLSQQALFIDSYKGEAAKEITQKGEDVKRAVAVELPPAFGENNYNGYIRFLSDRYSVEIIILDGEGNLIHPKDPNLQPDSPEYKEYYYQESEVKLLKRKLGEVEKEQVVFEGEGEYVYGAEILLHGDTMYLRVSQPTKLIEAALDRMNVRTALTVVFVFLVSFAVSSGIAGWLVNPLTELTKKARRLAEGDFDVDFHGEDYGRELVELAESLNFARDELAKTDGMQKELIANVSHDFKTPLTMIKGYASLIMEISGNNPEKRQKHAQIIVDEADRLTSLVNDVLDLSKIRSGIATLEMEPIDMSEYLREILDRFAYLKDAQGYSFEVGIEEKLSTRADRLKIGQALYNLIGNAVNYTGADKKVFVSLQKVNEECFRFAVTDTGAGIKPEELNEIWERYYRSSETHKRPVKGTGLGLSIVKTILQRHGFLFGVESKVGEGSTFYVLFPSFSAHLTGETVDEKGKA